MQVGDPFMEKLVCEACLELLATGAVAGIQDMGAAGLTCSTCETAARAGTGIEIELDKVPQRGPNMSSYEIMLSESQERMLIIVHKGREEEVKRIFDKWDLPWSEVGTVTDTGRMVVKHGGGWWRTFRPRRSPTNRRSISGNRGSRSICRPSGRSGWTASPDTNDPLARFATIAGAGRASRPRTGCIGNMITWCATARWFAPAAMRRSSASRPIHCRRSTNGAAVPEKLVALTVDCNGVYVYLDPYEGGKAAVAEACRNLACSGAVPLGATDNLNMANPHNPELFWQMRESVRGLADGCRAFDAPVTGGNCSLYNQNPDGPIDPTPTVAVVGLVERPEYVTTQWFKDEGDAIILLGDIVDASDPLLGLGGSAYLQVVHGRKNGSPPRCDLETARTLHTTLLGLIQSGLVKSAHDGSDGGLAVCLAEGCISQLIARETPRLIGAQLDLTAYKDIRLDALLFGETQSRVVVTCAPRDAYKVVERAKLMGVPAAAIGKVGGQELEIKTAAGGFKTPVAGLHDGWWNAIARAMG